MKANLPQLIENALTFIFPSSCLHCLEEEIPASQCFCQHCQNMIEIIDCDERCPRCFSAFYDRDSKRCNDCYQKPSHFIGLAAVSEYIGPAETLIKRLKNNRHISLAKGIAAYMSVQYAKLDWPTPDLVVPVPASFSQRTLRGYNHAAIIAEHFSKNLKVPCKSIVARTRNDLSQSGLSQKQRLKNLAPFKLKRSIDPKIRNILIIDDYFQTRASLNKTANAILKEHSCYTYGLTFCQR